MISVYLHKKGDCSLDLRGFEPAKTYGTGSASKIVAYVRQSRDGLLSIAMHIKDSLAKTLVEKSNDDNPDSLIDAVRDFHQEVRKWISLVDGSRKSDEELSVFIHLSMGGASYRIFNKRLTVAANTMHERHFNFFAITCGDGLAYNKRLIGNEKLVPPETKEGVWAALKELYAQRDPAYKYHPWKESAMEMDVTQGEDAKSTKAQENRSASPKDEEMQGASSADKPREVDKPQVKSSQAESTEGWPLRRYMRMSMAVVMLLVAISGCACSWMLAFRASSSAERLMQSGLALLFSLLVVGIICSLWRMLNCMKVLKGRILAEFIQQVNASSLDAEKRKMYQQQYLDELLAIWQGRSNEG